MNAIVSPSNLQRAASVVRAKLWSTFAEICELLRIEVGDSFPVGLQFQHIRIKAGQSVYRQLYPFGSLYVVNSGYLKSVVLDGAGSERVLSFPMRGDLLGLDAIHAGRHPSEAVALTDCDVIAISYKQFSALCTSHHALGMAFHGLLSRALAQEQRVSTGIATLSSEARVAQFLAELGERHGELGYSGRQFTMRMSREELGSYLSLTLETVSRMIGAIADAGLITVERRDIVITDMAGLKALRRLPAATRLRKKV